MKSFPLILIGAVVFLSSCHEIKSYSGGGFGGNGGTGNVSSIVTISGRVMSTATFNTTQSSIFGLSVEGDYFPVLDDCANSSWSLQYVGGGGKEIASGTADASGNFEVPAITSGKEGLITFNCASGIQKCLVKAGDAGLSCNSIADGVVGALEGSLGKSLTSTELMGKTMAKVASSIVESTNSDSAEAESLKNAMTICKSLPTNNSAQIAAKNSCYKDSLESSSQSSTLQVVKTLAQGWSVRSLFNFITTTAGYRIYLDSMVYSDFGAAFDTWLDTDFIAQVRAFIADLVTNPEYVQGDPTKGEHSVKMDCQTWYNKYQTGGQTTYKPALEVVNGVATPTCYNVAALQNLIGLDPSNTTDPRLLSIRDAILNDDHGNVMIQLGVPGDLDGSGAIDNGETLVDFVPNTADPITTDPTRNCENGGSLAWQTPGYFCVGVPSLIITAKVQEPNRNDVTGEKSAWEQTPSVSLIEVFEPVNTRLDEMNAISDNAASPYFNCVNFDNNSGAPDIDFGRTICKNWAQAEFSALKKEFSGLLGIYMYLKDPSDYGSTTSSKLSLDDIHRLFSKKNFYNGKLLAVTQGNYGGRRVTGNIFSDPVLDLRDATKAVIPEVFNWTNQNGGDLAEAAFLDIITNGSLLNYYNTTFKMFESVPTTSSLQALVQSASHHEGWNPWGSKYSNIPGMKRSVSGVDTNFPIFCRMLNRTKKDALNNLLPMEKELSSATKIECLTNPQSAGVVAEATEGLWTVPSTFTYPYVLQFRGYNGDGKGGLYTLANRKTGMSVRVGNGEVYILEGHNGNDSSIMVSGYTCPAGTTDPNTSAAPIVKAKVFYGWGDNSKSDIVNAYCLNMSGLLASDNDTRLYFGGDMEISQIDNNGNVNTWKTGLLGGRLSTSTTYNLNPVCVFFQTDPLELNTSTWKYQIKTSEAANYTLANYTDQWGNALKRIDALAGTDIVDFCDQDHANTTKYYLTHFWDNSLYDVTNAGVRATKPVQLLRTSDKLNPWGVLVGIGAVEAKVANLKVANTQGVTYSQNITLLNQKHDPKFDPFCDDSNGNGCDCYIGTSSTLRDNPAACTLADTAAEPTISNPPYWPNQPNAADYEQFFADFGNKWGAQLVLNGNPATPLNNQYLNSNNINMRLEEILICKYAKTGETTYRRPTQIVWENFSNLHFQGCPDSNGDIVAVTYNAGQPDSGGGPVRVINPKQMKNAYDIARPNTFLSLMSYALKGVSQGTTLSRTAKVFTFDEALALVSARTLMPSRSLNIRTEANAVVPGAYGRFSSVRYSEDQDVSAISAVLKAITKPTVLAQPDP